jgi:heat shock protein HslJ
MHHHLVSHRRAAIATALAAITLALPATVAAAAGRAADQQIADDSVLTADDVPAGFNEARASDDPDVQPGAACKAIRAAAKAADAAAHTEVEFRTPGDASGSALINNQVSVFGSTKKAKATYAAYAASTAKRCLTTAYERIFLQQLANPSARVRVTAERFAPDLGDAAVGYDVVIEASAQGDTQKFYVEVEVARVGRGLDAFGFFNTGGRPPSDDVVAMTEASVGKLTAALEDAG